MPTTMKVCVKKEISIKHKTVKQYVPNYRKNCNTYGKCFIYAQNKKNATNWKTH